MFANLNTPYYLYDLSLLRDTLSALDVASKQYGYHIHYALKANSNTRIVREILNFGFGVDCVSGNEIKKSLALNCPSSTIVFAGVGKRDDEILLAMESDIAMFHCESIHELKVINELAIEAQKQVNVAIRVNPNVDAKTHFYITTGIEENKFGIEACNLMEAIECCKSLSNINFRGLHFHIGSQIMQLDVFSRLAQKVNIIVNDLMDHNITIDYLNLGGGLGINYEQPDKAIIPDFDSYFKAFYDILILPKNISIHFELGRSVVGQSGSLITKVLFIKSGSKRNFAIVDAGMTELIRPALYGAYHQIECLENNIDSKILKYDIVGPICESSDVFGKAIALPELNRGDRIKIRSAGAYGEVMRLNYNQRDIAPAFYIDD